MTKSLDEIAGEVQMNAFDLLYSMRIFADYTLTDITRAFEARKG